MFGRIFSSRVTPLLGIVALCGLTACGQSAKSASYRIVSYKNPVYPQDFPDPDVLKAGKTYYAYATMPSGGGAFVPEMKSTDLVHWKANGDAMPIPPTWADGYWAPSVARANNGKYVLYFTGHDPQLLKQCVGVAVSATPRGYFRDTTTKPWLCQTKLGGTIDADAFRDGSSLYLYFKNDGNCCGIPTTIWVQRLSADGMKLVGKRVALIKNGQGWEGDNIEAPYMVKHAGAYFLFFSGNHFDSASYAVGYATCRGPLGPCTQAANNPILQYRSGGCDAEGPGGETIVTDDAGKTWMFYHAWLGDNTEIATGGTRALFLDALEWNNGKPSVAGPTCKKETGPAI